MQLAGIADKQGCDRAGQPHEEVQQEQLYDKAASYTPSATNFGKSTTASTEALGYGHHLFSPGDDCHDNNSPVLDRYRYYHRRGEYDYCDPQPETSGFRPMWKNRFGSTSAAISSSLHSSCITSPHARSDYMAASRRSPLIEDQWHGDDGDRQLQHGARRRHRDREHRSRRQTSRSPTRPAATAPSNSHAPPPGRDRDRRESDLRSSRQRPRSRDHHHHHRHSERSLRDPEPKAESRVEAEARRREAEVEHERSYTSHGRHRERSLEAGSKRYREEGVEDRRRSLHQLERQEKRHEQDLRGEERHRRRRSKERAGPRKREEYSTGRPSEERPYRTSREFDAASDRPGFPPRRTQRERSGSPTHAKYRFGEEEPKRGPPRGDFDDYHRSHRARQEEHLEPQHPRKKELFPDIVRNKRTREVSPVRSQSSRYAESHRRSRHTEDFEPGRDGEHPRSRPQRRSRERRMQSTRPIQSILDEQPRRAPTPPRPIPSFDDGRSSAGSPMREQFPMHGMKVQDIHGHRRGPPHIDTRAHYAGSPPQYATPTSSHHGSPHSGSPFSAGRGGWGGPPQFAPQA